VYAVRNYYKEDYSDEENTVYINEYGMCRWNTDGALMEYYPLDEAIGDDGWIYTVDKISGDSIMVMIQTGDGDYIRAVINGESLAFMPVDDEIWSNSSSVVAANDGTVYILYYNENDNWSLYATAYDFENDVAGEPVKLSDTLSYGGYQCVAAGYDTDLIFCMNGGVFSYNIGDDDVTQIMSIINSDLSAYNLNNFSVVDEEHFIAFYNEYNTYETKGAYFTKVKPEDIPDKEVIVFAGNWISNDIKSRVVEFNKSSSEYRIVTEDYSDYNTNEDYDAGYTKLNNDIITGNMPDILLTDSSMPIENYISKGLLANVDELIDNDAELGNTEFLENVFDAYRVDGKLYNVIPYFGVQTFIAKTSLVGSRSSWTMEEFNEIVSSLPEDMSIFGDYTRESFLRSMMMYSGRDFIDISTGKCSFDSDNFIKLLEYANTMPAETDYDYTDYWENYSSQYRDNRTLLMPVYIYSMRDMSINLNGYFDEQVSFIGFPTDSGQGGVINGGNNFVISARSSCIDGAWEFVRYYLTDEYQESIEYGIPVSRDAFDAWAASGMEKPYYIDADGEKHEYDNTFYMNNEEIILPVLTQEQIDQITEYIETVNKPVYYNDDVSNIVSEEAAAYFSGQKTAEEVAAVIQSRVQIYVNENR
ncbi:MAG: extracellular solute-binding protein, partial [Lachnospiraceae bacterium]|nr:extracellular solute-binding protein [Lachnospiraceae bacterium]